MTDATLLPFDLSAVRRKKLTVDFGGGNILLSRLDSLAYALPCQRFADTLAATSA